MASVLVIIKIPTGICNIVAGVLYFVFTYFLLKERWNIWIAVIVPSVLFGLVHVIGMDFSLGSCLLVILAGTMVGIMFSLIEIESGSVIALIAYIVVAVFAFVMIKKKRKD